MRKNIGTIALAAAALIFLAAIGARLFWPKPAPPLPLRVANAGQLSVLNIIAKENGYFSAHNLDVTVTEHESGGAAVSEMLAGNADVSVAADFVGARNIFTRPDLRILASLAVRNSHVYQIVSRGDRGIVFPSDLRGKQIGVSRKTVGEFYLGRFLRFNGLEIEDVTLVDLPPAAQIEQMSSGKIDAVVTFEPTAFAIERALGENAVAWSAQGGLSAYGLAYTTADFAAAQPDALKRYLQALREAESFIKAHNAEAREIVAAALSLDMAYLDYAWPNLRPEVRLDQELILTLETQGGWLIDTALTDKKEVPNFLDNVYADAIRAAAPDAITLIH